MKRVETYKGSGEYVNAAQDSDMATLRPVFTAAEVAWHREWVNRGCIDEGSSCLGVGVSIYYLPPRARTPQRLQVVPWNGSQGDFEAERTKSIPLSMLEKCGVTATYDCGRMD